MLTVDLQGRVERMNLRRHQGLQPLFEAVSNSIHAIQATGRSDGSIKIELLRHDLQGRLALSADGRTDRSVAEIIEMRVTDNGIGFNKENFEAFCELDTRYKVSVGGKGVGRLLWLKVFDHVSVDSIYSSSGGLRRRKFDFLLPSGVENDDDQEIPTQERVERSTAVTLSGPREPYRQALHHRAITVRDSIVRHFASYLLARDAPQIELVDGDDTLVASLEDDRQGPGRLCVR